MFNFFSKLLSFNKPTTNRALYGFEDAFENSAIGMAFVSFDGKWLKVNNALAKIVGYTIEELLHKKFQDITHPEDLQRDVGYVKDMVAGKIDHYQLQKRYISKLGHVVPVLLSVSFVRNSDGSPKHFLSQVIDLSSFEKLEQQTTKIQSHLEQVFEHMSEAFSDQKILLNRDGKIADFEFLLVNKAFEDLIGLNKEEIVGKKMSILPYGSEKELNKLLIQGGEAALLGNDFSAEFFFQTKNKWLQIHTFSSIKYEFSMILTDITDRKMTEEKLKEQIVELTKINDIMTNREIRIAELKEQLKKQESLT